MTVVKKAYLTVTFHCKGATDEKGNIGDLRKDVTTEIPLSDMPANGESRDFESHIEPLAGPLMEETKAEAVLLIGTHVTIGYGRANTAVQ